MKKKASNVLNIIFIMFIYGCNTLSVDISDRTVSFETSEYKIEFQTSTFSEYLPLQRELYSGRFEVERIHSFWIREDWYIHFFIEQTESIKFSSYFCKQTLSNIQSKNANLRGQSTFVLNRFAGEALSYFMKDSIMSPEEKETGMMYFYNHLGNFSMILEVVKYNYTSNDKPEFQNILNRFTITEKN